ncbi:MAG: hypothetical protein HFH13_03005 [Dorea sp.]|nr:hypothetical protein [Dorea sp.]
MALENRDRHKQIQRWWKDFYCRLVKIFVLILAVTFIINLIKKDGTFSEEENRVLAKRPEFTWDSVKSGKYMAEFETYISDQFFARNQWITLKLYEDRFLGKRESNGVYLGKKGYLMEAADNPDWGNVEKNMDSMASFAEKYPDVPVYLSLVPNAAYILKDKLPYGAPCRDQSEDIQKVNSMAGDSIQVIRVEEALKKHAKEDIYYRTDHHWTSLGASYAFEKLAEEMKIENPETDYQVYIVADDFEGTLASKSGYHKSRDAIQVYEPKSHDTEYIVMYVEEGSKSASIYKSECLQEKDKYTVFFGGNHARIDISTTLKEERNLLLVKDSYANCMVQFLLPYYQNIIMIDPRYFYESVDNIMGSYGITEVLFLYNVNTFLGDHSIADVLA